MTSPTSDAAGIDATAGNETVERSALQPMLTPSVDQRAENPLLPKVSFLILLIITSLAAFTFLLIRGWIQGSQVATAGLYIVATLGVLFAAFGLLAAIAWVPAAVMNDRYSELNLGNPFGDEQLPKQIIRPRDPET